MNRAELNPYRDLLLKLRARITGDVNQLQENSLRGKPFGSQWRSFQHADPYGRYRQRQLRAGVSSESDGKRRAALEKIQVVAGPHQRGNIRGLRRMRGKIPKARLNAIPYTTLCVNLQDVASGSRKLT